MRRRWQQRAEESCGAAALMTALAEMAGLPLSEEEELALREQLRAEGAYQASLPGRIAIEASSRGVDAVVYQDDERLQAIEREMGHVALFDVASLLAQHKAALREAENRGPAVHREASNPLVFLDRMRQGDRLLLASVVPANGGVVLHWRLYRMEGGVIYEMDPETGHDTPLTENQFVDRLPTHIGVAVSTLAMRLTPPGAR